VTWVGAHECRVSKRHLVSATQAVLQARRLRAAASLADWPTLRSELLNFRAKISLSGAVSFEAGTDDEWRQGTNDDLVLATALGIWTGECGRLAPRPELSIATAWSDVP
jgi:hypothetical protein